MRPKLRRRALFSVARFPFVCVAVVAAVKIRANLRLFFDARPLKLRQLSFSAAPPRTRAAAFFTPKTQAPFNAKSPFDPQEPKRLSRRRSVVCLKTRPPTLEPSFKRQIGTPFAERSTKMRKRVVRTPNDTPSTFETDDQFQNAINVSRIGCRGELCGDRTFCVRLRERRG